ncbi:MAG: hypothetical protein N2484_12020 [Clostridia bacterium]|nr:hypothetical protein [Clostridia bacterium]
MKMSKTAATILAFTLGAVIFVTTAFADVALGSGYDTLKASMKHTISQVLKNQKNFTFESSFEIKDNGTFLVQGSGFSKVDNEKNEFESTTVNKYSSGKTTTHYSYSDSSVRIWRNEMDTEEKYYISEYPNNNNKAIKDNFRNPFEQKGADEAEKLFDAVVGNLKNYIQVENKKDGGKEYTGSIAEAQVPALVNAVSSYFFKRSVMDRPSDRDEFKFPQLEKDIHISKVSAKALENSSGMLENVLAEVTLAGKDNNGVNHELSMNVAIKFTDIDKTVISKPNIEGKKIEKVSPYGVFDSRYIGVYKNNIVILKDGKFVKAGERVLEIIKVDSKNISGRYHEVMKPGFEEYSSKYDFSFECSQEDNNPNGHRYAFSYINPTGKKEMGMINMSMNGTLYLNLNIEIIDEHSTRGYGIGKEFDGDFHRVFED